MYLHPCVSERLGSCLVCTGDPFRPSRPRPVESPLPKRPEMTRVNLFLDVNTMPPNLLLEVKVVVSSTSSLAELASNFPTDDSVKRMMDNVFSKFKAQCLRVKRSCRKNALVSFMEFMNQTYLDACNHQALQTPTQSPLKRRRGVPLSIVTCSLILLQACR